MKPINILSLAAIFLICLSAKSQTDTIKTTSKITDVTVFLQGAEVKRDVNINAAKGRHILLIEGLPKSLDPDRIQALRINGLEILSVNSQTRNPDNSKFKAAKDKQENKIKTIEDAIRVKREKRAVLATQETLLMANIDFQGENAGATVAQIREAADFYNERLTSLIDKRIAIDLEVRALVDELKLVYQELNKVNNASSIPETAVLITVQCEKQVSGSLKLQYFVSLAGWKPSYDFRVEDTDQPLSVVYNGDVYQSTGEDWTNVGLTLSSANPNISSTAPKLETWYVNRGEPQVYTPKAVGIGGVEGQISDIESGEPLPFVNVEIAQNNQMIAGASSDMDGRFLIKPLMAGSYQLTVSYLGYNPLTYSVYIQDKKMEYLDIQMVPGIKLDEFEVVEYEVPLIQKDGRYSGDAISPNASMSRNKEKKSGSNLRGAREQSEAVYVDGIKVRGALGQTQAKPLMKVTPTDIAYKIEVPFTIPSDGRDHLISIKEESAKAGYVYKAVPKLDKDAFLIANLPDWSELNLLSGNTSIYYQGAYKGKAYLDTDLAVDTLEISLGRDQSIKIERKANKEIDDKRFIGKNTKQTIGWDITVRNNKSNPIEIELYDQFPLSELESIEVERLDSGGAKLDDKKGQLIWTLDIPAASSKKVSFSYSIKYPTSSNYLR